MAVRGGDQESAVSPSLVSAEPPLPPALYVPRGRPEWGNLHSASEREERSGELGSLIPTCTGQRPRHPVPWPGLWSLLLPLSLLA